MTELSGISIETFRGDFEALERMALLSWREEYGEASFPNFYRPAFLHYLTDRIEDKAHLLAAYKGEEIVGFMANLPQKMKYGQKIYSAVYTCLLVIRKEYLRKALASLIIQKALERSKDYNYDFSLLTLESGHSSTKMMKKIAGFRHPLYFVKRIRVIARVLDLERVCESEALKRWERWGIKLLGGARPPSPKYDHLVREYRPENLDACLELLNRYQQHQKKNSLALVWDRENLAIELAYPDVSQTIIYEKNNRVAGLINFIYHDHIGRTTARWAWVNHVAYPELSAAERTGFIHAFLRFARRKGCVGVIEWTRGYYPQGPFYRAHFFPYFRSVNMFSWSLNPEVVIQNVRRVYEIQV